MPSPFPGMDPYLEDPGLWPDVHHEILSEARASLGRQLRPKYLVRIEERVFVSDDDDPGRSVLIPDLRIADQPGWQNRPARTTTTTTTTTGDTGGGLELAEAQPVEAITMIEDQVREARLEILDRQQRRVVTVIELLSPANKVPGARGRDSFARKRHEVLNSPCHWVEIDLLRAGDGVTSRQAVLPCEYLAHVSRATHRPRGVLWPIRLSQRLPRLPVPLHPEDPDGTLDLQAVLSLAYDRAGYDLATDYTREPVPPLTPEWAEWANRLLTEKGLRNP